MKNFKFSLRKQGKSDPVIVFHVFDGRFKGRKFMYSTGYYSQLSDWDKKKEQSRLPHINKHLNLLRDSAREFMEARTNSGTLSRKDLKEFLLSKLKDEAAESEIQRIETEEIWKVWEEIIDTTKNKDGEPLNASTKKQKNQTMLKVKAYAKEKHIRITFQKMDIKFYHAFDKWLSDGGLSGNTRGKHLKEVKAILREADDRSIPVNPDHRKKSWKVIKKSPESVFLNYQEIRKIFDLDESKLTPEDQVHKDIFVMACFVGARHSDWSQIRPENVITENKRELLRYKQTKTGGVVHIPIHPAVKTIWFKYPQFPKVISNQKFNDALKRIAEAAELGNCIINGQEVEKWTQISTHTARRSFATNAYLSKELDVYQIMRCTGHKTESAFLKYLKLDGRDYATLAADSKFFKEEWSILKVG
jgi:integrase